MADLSGHSLGRYHILERLGEGGLATVYKAYDTRLERDVAVKVLRTEQFPPIALERILKRFEREAKALAKLTHPNIVAVIDYGEQDGAPYLVMPYLPGGTLKQILKERGRLGWQEALRILLPIARALEYAHERNILHRDVKPSNILITESGEPMLSYFGIAKILETDEATLTGTGMGVGTPEYMAPEQWTGKPVPQSDIYSLGVVLFECVTGRKPYTADTPMAIAIKHATEPLPRPGNFAPDLPLSLEYVLLKALAREAENRYASMEEFITALQTVLSHPKAHTQEATFTSTTIDGLEAGTVSTLVEGQPTQAASFPVPAAEMASSPPGAERSSSLSRWFALGLLLGPGSVCNTAGRVVGDLATSWLDGGFTRRSGSFLAGCGAQSLTHALS